MKPPCRAVWAAIIGLSIFAGSGVPLLADGTVRTVTSLERAETKKRIKHLIRSLDRLHAADRKMSEAYESALRTEQLNAGYMESEQLDWLSTRNAGVICEESTDEIECFERFVLARTNQIDLRREAAIAHGGEYIEKAQSLIDECWARAERGKPGRGIRWFMTANMDCLKTIIVRVRQLYGRTYTFEAGAYRLFDPDAFKKKITAFLLRFFALAESGLVCRGCGSIWIEIINSHNRQILQSLLGISVESYYERPNRLMFRPLGYETWKQRRP